MLRLSLVAGCIVFILFWTGMTHATSLCAGSVASRLAAESFGCFEFWLNRYQTLLTGLFAIASAALGASYINRQMNLTKDIEDRRQKGKDYANRALLPVALSRVHDYGIGCLDTLKQGKARAGSGTPLSVYPALPCPAIPDEPLTTLMRNIEFANDEAKERMADIIHRVQVQHSRLEFLIEKLNAGVSPLDAEFVSGCADCLEVLALVDTIFPYSRRERNTPDKFSINPKLHAVDWVDAQSLRNFLNMKEKHWVS